MHAPPLLSTLYAPSLDTIAELMENLAAYVGQTVLLKIGGNSISEDPSFLSNLARQMEFLQSRRVRLILIHGGGPQIDHDLKQSGLAITFGADGRRVTDAATVAVVGQSLKALGRTITEALGQARCHVYAPALANECLLEAEPLRASDPLSRIGRVAHVNTDRLTDLLNQGFLIVLNSLGVDSQGQLWNINADDAAMAVAKAMRVRRLILATNVPGVYDAARNPISLLTPDQAHGMIAEGVISGGMIPKVESALAALRDGVGGVAIVDAHRQWAILGELLTDRGFGTLISAA